MILEIELNHSSLKKGQNVTEEEILMEISRLEREASYQSTINKVSKVALNSIYGVLGYHSFILYDREIARSVSEQSSHVIRYTILFFNRYFQQRFPNHRELHAKMGITKCEPIDFNAVNYADTDSVFIRYKDIMDKTDYKGTLEEFVFDIGENDLNDCVKDMLVGYIRKFNGFQQKIDGQRSMKLAFEMICHNVLWTSKKKYIKNISWEEGVYFKPLENVEVKGLDINKSSTPKFVRELLRETVHYILQHRELNLRDFIDHVKMQKSKFESANVEDVAISQRVNGYEKYVITAKNGVFKYVKGITIQIRASSVYNAELAKSKYKHKYQQIRSGMKIQYYYSTDPRSDVFAFVNGDPCYEFLYPIDYSKQFEMLYLSPLNKIITSIGVQALPVSLIAFDPLW